MLGQSRSAVLSAFPTLAAAGGAATATTIDTFSFSDSGKWIALSSGGIENLLLIGSFTGAVGPDGFIQQGDLMAFQGTLGFAGLSPDDTLRLNNLVLFSFDPTGAALGVPVVTSSLDFIDDNVAEFPGGGYLCVGAAATLSPACNPSGAYPAGTFADLTVPATPSNLPIFDYLLNAPSVTLVSSVNEVPETPIWAMMLAGFAGLCFAGSRTFRSRPASA
jgi:hypothetical protein